MSKIETVELPSTVVRLLLGKVLESGPDDPFRNLLNEIEDECSPTPRVISEWDAISAWNQWKQQLSGLSYAELCAIQRTLHACRNSPSMGPGELRDLDVLEKLAQQKLRFDDWSPKI